ncbi:MAG TPA: tRNA epoxyqueuosine(34) reductase QueG [Terriglobia bacterium]|nr:tRNA epoxyqueuosine(34) reductase QueG [Terriglobia bacterium]
MPLHLLIKKKALEIGFDLAGISPIGVWKDLDFARRWVEEGRGGEMHYLENPKRQDPRTVLPSAQSVVCVGLIYNTPFPYSTEVARERSENIYSSEGTDGGPVPRAWISRYAWGQDYHEIMRAKLEDLRKAIANLAPEAETRVYADTGPVVERAFARHSGIGWTGKNTCLINPSKGSWFFLGVILTSLTLEPDLPAPDRCGSCTRCLDACPTGALTEPYVMDASRCIAYFNIELKGSIPEEYRADIGMNLFGCDICQDVCPWNRRQNSKAMSRQHSAPTAPKAGKGFGRPGAAATSLPEFQPLEIKLPRRNGLGEVIASRSSTQTGPDNGVASSPPTSFSLFNPPLDKLAELTEQDFRRVFAHSPIKRPKYRGWLRNLSVVLGNSGDRRFLSNLEELSRHDDPIVREHAQWAIARLNRT